MKLVYKTVVLLLVSLLYVGNLQAIGGEEYTKTIKKEFGITTNGVVNITNKYGKVEIETWDRDRVKVEVRITVVASSEKNAQEVFDRIRIDFANRSDYIKAQTEIASKKSSWWSWATGSDSDFYIDYRIKVPKSINLELSNKYGDVIIPNMDGWAKLELKHGNFDIKKMSDDIQVDVQHGNGILESGKDVKINGVHSNLTIKQADKMELTTKHTNVAIKEAGEISCSSKYDNYAIGRVSDFSNNGKYDNIDIESAGQVDINTKYSHLRLMAISQKLDLNMEYGDAIVKQLARGFENVNLDGRHTEFQLGIEPGAAFRFDASASYAAVRYPDNMTVTYEVEKNTDKTIKGFIRDENTNRIIKARLSYGGLVIAQ
jgi:hypothetical protein